MELSPYLERLATDLEKITALADDATREVTRRLATALEPSLRMALVEAISDTAALVTADLDDVVAVVRMEGRDPVIAVERTGSPSDPRALLAADPTDENDADSARITVRLPQGLKTRAESRAAELDQSLNTWIVQAIRRATQDEKTSTTSSRRITGWA